MSRFFSIPGMAPSQPKDERGRLALPDIRDEAHEAQLGEWLRSREGSTSHLEVGLNRGDKVGFVDATGERRPAIVEGEERDAHSGKVDVYLRANDPNGSGSYKMTFEGDTDRSLKSSRVKRIHE
jgi:hypothetical protein